MWRGLLVALLMCAGCTGDESATDARSAEVVSKTRAAPLDSLEQPGCTGSAFAFSGRFQLERGWATLSVNGVQVDSLLSVGRSTYNYTELTQPLLVGRGNRVVFRVYPVQERADVRTITFEEDRFSGRVYVNKGSDPPRHDLGALYRAWRSEALAAWERAGWGAADAQVMDDKEDRVQVLTTGEHTILLDDKNKRIEIQSTKGRKILLDDENEVMSVVSEKGHKMHLSDKDDNLTVADADDKHVLTLDYKNKAMSLVTEGSISLDAKEAVEIKGKSVLIESEKDTTVDAGGNLAQTAGKDATVEAKGSATIDAKKDFAATATKGATLEGMDVVVNGKKSLAAEGKVEAALSGTKLALEGKATAEITSAMLKVNG